MLYEALLHVLVVVLLLFIIIIIIVVVVIIIVYYHDYGVFKELRMIIFFVHALRMIYKNLYH